MPTNVITRKPDDAKRKKRKLDDSEKTSAFLAKVEIFHNPCNELTDIDGMKTAVDELLKSTMSLEELVVCKSLRGLTPVELALRCVVDEYYSPWYDSRGMDRRLRTMVDLVGSFLKAQARVEAKERKKKKKKKQREKLPSIGAMGYQALQKVVTYSSLNERAFSERDGTRYDKFVTIPPAWETLVQPLLDAGADINPRGDPWKHEESLLHDLLRNENLEHCQDDRMLALVDRLVAAGCNPIIGNTPMIGDSKLVSTLRYRKLSKTLRRIQELKAIHQETSDLSSEELWDTNYEDKSVGRLAKLGGLSAEKLSSVLPRGQRIEVAHKIVVGAPKRPSKPRKAIEDGLAAERHCMRAWLQQSQPSRASGTGT